MLALLIGQILLVGLMIRTAMGEIADAIDRVR
jgi:hypothetical protein